MSNCPANSIMLKDPSPRMRMKKLQWQRRRARRLDLNTELLREGDTALALVVVLHRSSRATERSGKALLRLTGGFGVRGVYRGSNFSKWCLGSNSLAFSMQTILDIFRCGLEPVFLRACAQEQLRSWCAVSLKSQGLARPAARVDADEIARIREMNGKCSTLTIEYIFQENEPKWASLISRGAPALGQS